MEVRTERYVTTSEVCEIMKCSSRTIWRMIRAGKFPEGVKHGKSRVWRERDVIDVADIGQPTKKAMKIILENAAA